MSQNTIQTKIEQIRNETQQHGNTRARVADLLTTLNTEKLDKAAVQGVVSEIVNLAPEFLEYVQSGNFTINADAGFGGNLVIADNPAPTKPTWYFAKESGTYPNAGGLVVDLSGKLVILNFDGTTWSKVDVELNVPNGKVEEGNTQAVSGGEVYNSILGIENASLSYKYTGNNNAREFTELIKNIFIKSTYSDISVEYVGINDQNWRKFYIMLKSGDKLASFILSADDIRPLNGETIELLKKEEDVSFRENTRVWIEFNDIDFPTISEVSFLEHEPDFEFYQKAFNFSPKTVAYSIDASSLSDASVIAFSNIVENVYFVDSKNRINKNNIDVATVIINQYPNDPEQRYLLFAFNFDGNLNQYYTKIPPKKGSRVRLEYKEGNLKDIEIYVDFRNFPSYPANNITIVYFGAKIHLTDSAFTNFELNTKAVIEKLEASNPKLNVVSVSKEVGGNNALQLSINNITDASASNRYQINVAAGYYEIHKKEDFIGNPGYPAMICPKNHVDIKGQSRTSTIFYCDLSESPTEPIDSYQTMYNWANDVRISDLTLITKNLRYVLHQDNPQEANGTRYYENVDFIFLGNGGYWRALGTGTYSGSRTFVTEGSSQSQVYATFTVHNNKAFEKPSLWHFKNHSFVTTDFNEIIHAYNCGSNQDCQIILENCSFSGAFIFLYEEYWLYESNLNDHFNHANWRIQGGNNSPFYFKNQVQGKTLAIETISKNKNSKVRFDITSTAYPLLIANNKKNYFGHLGNPNRRIKDAYVIQDGANGLSAFAFGGLSIKENNYAIGNLVSNDSLGKRLGDCSATNKTLGIIIDGVNYNVVFNKNYTSFTNAQVIAEINTVIGSVATAKEYNIGADYYAEMTDVVSIEVNASSNTIPKGTLVTKFGNKIAPCGENDLLYGLLIDDLGAYELDSDGVTTSKGRIIKNCYVSLESGNVSSVLNSGTGSRYKVSGGKFVADANGSFKVFSDKFIKI